MLTEEQIERYSRHIMLKEVGGKGQKKLLNGRVLIIGAGGLGSPIALYLAAAGVGTIGIADADIVDLSNLQRQIAHHTRDIGMPKVESAKAKMVAMNPDVTVNTYQTWVSAANIADIMRDYDFVIDGTDNFAAKFLINDACVLAGKPYSHGGILQFDGQTMTVKPGESACYRCIFPTPPPKDAIPTCSQAGVIGVLPGRARHHPGDRGDQVPPREGGTADRAAVDLQRPPDEIPRGARPEEPRTARSAGRTRPSPS